MRTWDRIFFIIISCLAMGTVIVGVEGTGNVPFLILAIAFFGLSLIGYFLFYSLLTTGWFYNLWALNGILIALAFYFEEVYVVLIPVTILWLALLASDYVSRQHH